MSSFGDIPNPQEASKAIQSFLRQFKTKICMAKSTDCSGTIIDAHTLSKQAMLRPISRDGHVYSLVANLYQPTANGPSTLKLTGIGDTSTFAGFCSYHDKELFSCIEDKAFNCTSKQLFILAYRAVAKEAYLKRKQAESLLPVVTVRKIHNIDDEIDIQLSPEALYFQQVSMRGAEDIERIKTKMDELLASGDYCQIKTTVIPFKSRPPLTANFVFSPDLDFDGRQLQNFEDFTRDLDPLFVTLAPYDSGGYKGFMTMSYLTTRSTAAKMFIDSLLAQQDLATAITWFLFIHTENFACDPNWYENLPKQDLTEIDSAIRANVDFLAQEQASIKIPKIKVDPWEHDQAFEI